MKFPKSKIMIWDVIFIIIGVFFLYHLSFQIITKYPSKKKEWFKAKSINTINAYKSYIEKHPQSIYADSAQIKLEYLNFKYILAKNNIKDFTEFLNSHPNSKLRNYVIGQINRLRSERDNRFKESNIIKLSISEKFKIESISHDKSSTAFKEIERKYYNLQPFYKYIYHETLDILEASGFQVVFSDDVAYDCEFKIDINSSIIYAEYTGQIEGCHFTGASLSGNIILLVQKKIYSKNTFYSYRHPPVSIYSLHSSPDWAPIHECLNDSKFNEMLFNICFDAFGDNFLISLALENNSYAKSLLINGKKEKFISPLLSSFWIEPYYNITPEILGRFGVVAMDSLLRYVDDSNWKIRECIAISLGRNNMPKAINYLVELLNDKNSEVKSEAAYSLGLIADSRATVPLIRATKDKNPFVRQRAVGALGIVKDTSSIDEVINLMIDDEYSVAEEARVSIARFDTLALPVLEKRLDDKNPELQNEVNYMIKKIKSRWNND